MTKSLAIIGWGSQAQAWAKNLIGEHWQVRCYLREESLSFSAVRDQGISALPLNDSQLSQERFIALLFPDDQHLNFLQNYLPTLNSEAQIIWAHGHSFTQGKLREAYPERKFSLLAPKAIASELRARKEKGLPLGGVWDCTSTSPDDLVELQQLGRDLGLTTLLRSSFEEETLADLFSEQALLCSLLPYGAKRSFEILVEKGIQPELAFMECWMELKLIADTMVKMGPEHFFNLISPNALIGGQRASEQLLGADFEKKLQNIFEDIKSGEFDRHCQTVSVDEIRTQVLDEWKGSSLSATYKKLKFLVNEDQI